MKKNSNKKVLIVLCKMFFVIYVYTKKQKCESISCKLIDFYGICLDINDPNFNYSCNFNNNYNINNLNVINIIIMVLILFIVTIFIRCLCKKRNNHKQSQQDNFTYGTN